MLLAGGAVLFLTSFLDWYSIDTAFGSASANAWDTDAFGLLGILVALMGLAVAITVGLATFAGTKLPTDILGFSWNTIYVMFGFACSVVTVGFLFRGEVGIGLILGLIGALVMLAGAFMESQATARPAGPPTAF